MLYYFDKNLFCKSFVCDVFINLFHIGGVCIVRSLSGDMNNKPWIHKSKYQGE